MRIGPGEVLSCVIYLPTLCAPSLPRLLCTVDDLHPTRKGIFSMDSCGARVATGSKDSTVSLACLRPTGMECERYVRVRRLVFVRSFSGLIYLSMSSLLKKQKTIRLGPVVDELTLHHRLHTSRQQSANTYAACDNKSFRVGRLLQTCRPSIAALPALPLDGFWTLTLGFICCLLRDTADPTLAISTAWLVSSELWRARARRSVA